MPAGVFLIQISAHTMESNNSGTMSSTRRSAACFTHTLIRKLCVGIIDDSSPLGAVQSEVQQPGETRELTLFPFFFCAAAAGESKTSS